MKMKPWAKISICLGMIVAAAAFADQTITGNLTVTKDVTAGIGVRGQYAVYSNGRADGGDTVYESLGFPTRFLDNNRGVLRFFRSGVVDMSLDSNGLRVAQKLGVGTAGIAPAAPLDVHGNAIIRGEMDCEVLEIAGEGALDLAEAFKINDEGVLPGMVVAIDAVNVGELRLASLAYDSKVAGIISGAGDLKAGVQLGRNLIEEQGHHPVALTGRVWCYVDASSGAVAPGDLLTTSATPGHAMKAADRMRSQGAILGKAMTALPEGRGLVLVLVTLQ